MIDINVHYKNDTYATVECDCCIAEELKDYFSFFVENYRFNPKYKNGLWSGKINLFSTRNGDLPVGLVPLIEKFCNMMQYTFSIEPTFNPVNIPDKVFSEWLDAHPVYSKGKQIKPYWYQSDSIKHALEHRRSLLNLPTSAGKSLIIGLLSKYYLENYNKKVLIVVPNVQLVKQMQEDLIDYGLFTQKDLLGIKAGTEKDSGASIYISTWQSASKLKKAWFQKFGMLLTDEVHLGVAKGLQAINVNLDDCKYKIGLTGSLKDAKTHTTQLIGLYGLVYKPVTTKQLMDEGKVSNLKPTCIVLKYNEQISKELKGLSYQDEIKWLITNKKRNLFISKLAAASKEQNTIVLFKNISHGKALYEIINKLLEGTNRKVYYIAGDVKSTDREQYRHLIESETGAVIIASYGTMSTGVSINNLHRAIFAHPTKSKIINLQSIGRILRKHTSKSFALLYDIIDDLSYKKHHNFALKHGLERIKLYSREKFDYIIKKVRI